MTYNILEIAYFVKVKCLKLLITMTNMILAGRAGEPSFNADDDDFNIDYIICILFYYLFICRNHLTGVILACNFCYVAALPIKKVIQPKYRLPALNWITLNPNQIKGTMFHDLNDEKLFKVRIL